jgi:hypothetical protein
MRDSVFNDWQRIPFLFVSSKETVQFWLNSLRNERTKEKKKIINTILFGNRRGITPREMRTCRAVIGVLVIQTIGVCGLQKKHGFIQQTNKREKEDKKSGSDCYRYLAT